MQANLHLNSVTAMLLLDSDGNRLLAKYYEPTHVDPKNPNAFKNPFGTLKEQRAFEQGVFDKTRRATGQFSPLSHSPTPTAGLLDPLERRIFTTRLLTVK